MNAAETILDLSLASLFGTKNVNVINVDNILNMKTHTFQYTLNLKSACNRYFFYFVRFRIRERAASYVQVFKVCMETLLQRLIIAKFLATR